MRGVHFFMFLVAIPFLVGLGFDLYLWYLHMDKPFEFATPGYLWTHYDPDSYKWTVENANDLDPRIWPWINFALAKKSVIDGAVFAGVFYAILLILKICGFWPFQGDARVIHGGGNARTNEILGRKAKKFKYKRK